MRFRFKSLIAALVLLLFMAGMADSATLFNYPKFKGTTSIGAPLTGGLLYTYAPGTTTPKATYADSGQVTPNTNPVVLDANGEATIYFAGKYKVVLKDSAGVTQWTLDNLSGIYGQLSSYEVDATEYGTGACTRSTIATALAAIGTSTDATLTLKSCTWTFDQNTDWSSYSRVQFKFAPGAIFSHGAYTIKIPTVNAGGYQIFTGSGAVAITGPLTEVDADWWYSGTGDASVAINAALAAAKTSTSNAPTLRLKNRSYTLTAPIAWNTHVNIKGAGMSSTLLYPAAGIIAIEVGYTSPGARFSTISDLSIYGGKGGIKFSGGAGSYLLHPVLRNLYIDQPTENCILVDDMDVQNGVFDNVRTYGGLRGWLIKGITSSNRNTWIGGEATAATEAGIELDGSAVTYAIAGPVMINTVIENNGKYGLVLKNVTAGLFLGLHLEGNGTNATGGPWANIALYGQSAVLPTTTLTFDTCTNVASGANQGGLILQVKDAYVRGPIYFRNNILRSTDIVDLSTGLISGITQYVAFVNEGIYPVVVQGDTKRIHNVEENMLINGSFETFNAGTTSPPYGWTVYGAGATAVRVAGTYSPYAVRFTGIAAGQNLRQLDMINRLKADTIYTVQVKYSMDVASTSGFTVNLLNDGTAVGAIFTETIAIADTGYLVKRAVIKTPSTLTGIVGFNVSQTAAGTVVLDVDEFQVNEGIEAFTKTWSRYDSVVDGVQVINYAAEITPDLSLGSVVDVYTAPASTNGDLKINNPTNAIVGKTFSVRYNCVTAGPDCNLTYGTSFVLGDAALTNTKTMITTFLIVGATSIVQVGNSGEY